MVLEIRMLGLFFRACVWCDLEHFIKMLKLFAYYIESVAGIYSTRISV